MRTDRLEQSLGGEQPGSGNMVADIAKSNTELCAQSVAALAQVRRGVITGEGPTIGGRLHFSRSIDIEDATLCARILVAGGGSGDAVSREEADALLDIYVVANERRDAGRFADLLVKAIVHHVMAASGLDVPRREHALSFAMPVYGWASGAGIDRNVARWLETRMSDLRSGDPAGPSIAKALSSSDPTQEMTLATVFNMAT